MLNGFKFYKSYSLLLLLFFITVTSLVLYGCATATVSKKNRLESNLYYRLGAQAFQNKNYIKAMQNFITANRYNPYSAKNYNGLGIVYMETYRDNKAIKCFKKAVGLDPNFSDSYYNLALIYLKKNLYLKAKIVLKKALNNPFYSTPYKSYTLLGAIYIREKNVKKAEKVLLVSRSIAPAYFRTYYQLGRLYMLTGDLDSSMINIKKALVLYPFYVPAQYEEGVLYFKTKEFAKAKSVFKKIYGNGHTGIYAVKSLKYLRKIKEISGN